LAEVRSIKATAQNDLNLVQSELAQFSTIGAGSAGLANPVDPVEGGFWDIVKLNPPRALLRDPETLGQIRDVARRTDQVNEMIRSRDAFKTSNARSSLLPRSLEASQFTAWVQAYDQLIELWLTELLEALETLEASLEKAAGSRSWMTKILEEARRAPRRTSPQPRQHRDLVSEAVRWAIAEVRRPPRRRL
jgi:hypothetical protein